MSEQDLTSIDHEGAGDNPTRAADSLTVHGFLSLLRPGESAEIDHRVDLAMRRIRAERGVLARLDFRRIAAVAALLAIVTIGLVAVPLFNQPTAYAALRSMVSANREVGGRAYEVSVERTAEDGQVRLTTGSLEIGSGGRHVFTVREGQIGEALAALGLGGMGRGGPPPGRSEDHHAMGRPDRPDGRPDGRPGEGGDGPPRQCLSQRRWGGNEQPPWACDPEAREHWRKRIAESAAKAQGGIVGSDGTSRWIVTPGGEIRRFPVPEGAQQDSELLMLDSILAKLERGFDASFVSGDSTTRGDGRPVLVVQATPRDQAPNRRIPRSVRVVADASSYEVLQLEAEWEGGEPKSRKSRILIDFVGPSDLPDSYFAPEAHASKGEATGTS